MTVEPASQHSIDLAAALAAVLGDGTNITRLTRLSGGASRETWSFDAERDGAAQPLILRRDPPGRPGEPGTMDLEHRLLRACHQAGLAVPAVVASDDGRVLGTAGLVMTRVAGETLARRIQRDDGFAEARRRFAGQCGAFLAGLQRIPVAQIDELPDVDPLAHFRDRWRAVQDVSPTFEVAFRWLEANRPPVRPPVIVHGDFRLGNLIVDGDGVAAVLDWELAHAGDPLEDLGWLCVKAWRFRGRRPVGGIGELDDLLDAYESAGGQRVDRDELRWWLVFNTLKWGVICGWQAASHLSGATPSVELAAIGRRIAEQEWDLLELLDPHACRVATDTATANGYDDMPPDDAGVYGRPTAVELLGATRGFVTDDVMPLTGEAGLVQFHSRVAANVLAIVERQLRLGPTQSSRHRAAFDGLGVTGVSELADAVRAGAWDGRGDQLRPALAALVRDKLAVANPRHLELPSAGGDIP